MTNKDILMKINEKTEGEEKLNKFIQELFNYETGISNGRYEAKYQALLEEHCPET